MPERAKPEETLVEARGRPSTKRTSAGCAHRQGVGPVRARIGKPRQGRVRAHRQARPRQGRAHASTRGRPCLRAHRPASAGRARARIDRPRKGLAPASARGQPCASAHRQASAGPRARIGRPRQGLAPPSARGRPRARASAGRAHASARGRPCARMKLWWRFRGKSSLWSEYLHGRYCRNLHPTIVPYNRNHSSVWHRLCRIRDVAEPFITVISRVKLTCLTTVNPAHVPYWWVNNPTLGEFCFTMIGRADIEGSKSNVAMNAWLPQASYPCGHAFTVRIRTGNQNQTSFYPSVPHEISVLVELILGHLRYLLTDVPPQPNSPPDNVFRPDRPAKASLGSKKISSYNHSCLIKDENQRPIRCPRLRLTRLTVGPYSYGLRA
ncbi:UNVERIFIED_CONTAM: putative uncharacterized protein ART2 [Sesamum calycinum]|uniref:Regulator of rDNA transcription protein 15 n=1 Tax=Sesamum calycinum TaxID=2727403 RepID=A0AAW2J5F5_9LAMI